jgi:hypothetical protein
VRVDLWTFGLKLVQVGPSASPPPLWSQARQIIGKSEGRVLPWGLSIFDQNGAGQVGLRSVFGYNALELQDYRALVSAAPDPRAPVYDLLGAAYVVSPVPLDDFTGGEDGLELVEAGKSVWVYRRARALPPAWLTSRVEVIPDPAQARARIADPTFDAALDAILEHDPPCRPDPASGPGMASVIEQRPGYWLVQTESRGEALLVIDEAYYPGWQARVDGRPAEVLQADVMLRAVCVPPGEHVVEWVFSPTLHALGAAISVASLGLVAWAVVTERRKPASDSRDKPEDAGDE